MEPVVERTSGTGRGWFGRLIDDEEGSATVEFIVLIPVYITLLAALFSVSFMVLSRQALVSAARYHAWTQEEATDQAIDRAFFGPYPGTYTGSPSSRDLTYSEDQLRPQGQEAQRLGGNPSANARRAAVSFLNNDLGQGRPLRLDQVDATFDYTGLLLGNRTVSIRTRAAVVRTNAHERPEHEEGQQTHFAADSSLGSPFDPADRDDRYLSPLVRPTFSREGGDPGIWDLRSRINGSVFAEQSYYRGQPKN